MYSTTYMTVLNLTIDLENFI